MVIKRAGAPAGLQLGASGRRGAGRARAASVQFARVLNSEFVEARALAAPARLLTAQRYVLVDTTRSRVRHASPGAHAYPSTAPVD